MNKAQIDELYHNLRELCVTLDVFQKEAILGITAHLMQPGGDYQGLLRFLSFYGGKYILPPVIELLRYAQSTGYLTEFSRVVELGAGFAWLSRGISNAYSQLLMLAVDKRQWVFTDIVADVESQNGVKRVLDELRDGDLIVMSELLHCLDEPEEMLRQFARWPMLVVEYCPSDPAYMKSYNAQIKRFGCKPVADIKDIFPGAKIIDANADPYKIWLILPLKKKEATS